MKTLREFELKLNLRGPVLTKSTSPSSFGVDAAASRAFNAKEPSRPGQPCLPGSLIKGKVREALEQIDETTDLDRLFGKNSEEGGGDDPERGAIVIGDLVAETQVRGNGRHHRVAIEHTLGSAKGQMLRVIETPYLAGETVHFSGIAYGYADDAKAKDIEEKLRLGLCWLTQVGSLRTTGFGRLLEADVTARNAATPTATPTFAAPVALELALKPRGPLCIARHKIGTNLFESEDIIPGNMLAGAIMEVAKALGIATSGFEDDFERICFRHAFPTTGLSRPRALPLSTVKAAEVAYDIAELREPVLLVDDKGELRAPAFSLDWKGYDDVLGELGWARPARELRVRTAIDSIKRRADRGDGEGGKLFAWEMVHPVTSNGTPIVWRSRIDLSHVSDPTGTATILVEVLGQLAFLSKTKARCDVEWTALPKPNSAPSLTAGQSLALVLQTPALLADPRFQSVKGIAITSGALSATDMLKLYRDVWTELSEGSLDLSHHFAQQFLAGSNYLANRFQRSKPYDPWLLTKEGSVFVFQVKNAGEAMKRREDWLGTGLPLPKWAVQRYGTHWKENPYRPENGFGEIAVHTPDFPKPKTQAINLAESVLP